MRIKTESLVAQISDVAELGSLLELSEHSASPAIASSSRSTRSPCRGESVSVSTCTYLSVADDVTTTPNRSRCRLVMTHVLTVIVDVLVLTWCRHAHVIDRQTSSTVRASQCVNPATPQRSQRSAPATPPPRR